MASEIANLQGQLFLEVLQKFGEAKLAVTGSSMLPSIWPGDVLEVCHCVAMGKSATSSASVALGDIVLFARGGGLVAHRVVRMIAEPARTLLVTRGDSMRSPDPPVLPEELLGRVKAIVHRGRQIAPSRTCWSRAASWLFAHSDLCTRVALRLARQAK